VLGSSVPGADKFQRVKKASVLSLFTDLAGDRTVTLQCPNQTLSPTLGKTCGRRERESRREGRREQSLRESTPSRDVAVKGILVFWKAALFAGRRWNEGLGRSASPMGIPPMAGQRADDSGCPKVRRGGERRHAYATKRMHPT